MHNITQISMENALHYIYGYTVGLELLYDKEVDYANESFTDKLDTLKTSIIKLIDSLIEKIKHFFSETLQSEAYNLQLHVGMKKFFDDGIEETKKVLMNINTSYSITMDYDRIKVDFESLINKWDNLKVMMSRAKIEQMDDINWKLCTKAYFTSIQNAFINPLEKMKKEVTKLDSELDLERKPYQSLIRYITNVLKIIQDCITSMQYGQKNDMKFVSNNNTFTVTI